MMEVEIKSKESLHNKAHYKRTYLQNGDEEFLYLGGDESVEFIATDGSGGHNSGV